jgi:hypothetical protein
MAIMPEWFILPLPKTPFVSRLLKLVSIADCPLTVLEDRGPTDWRVIPVRLIDTHIRSSFGGTFFDFFSAFKSELRVGCWSFL